MLTGLGVRGKPVFSSYVHQGTYSKPRELPAAPHPGSPELPRVVDGMQLPISKTCKLVPIEAFGGN